MPAKFTRYEHSHMPGSTFCHRSNLRPARLHQRVLVTCLLVVAIQAPAQAWPAKDSISGQVINVVSPPRSEDVGKNGNHELMYTYRGEPEIHMGEMTSWLSRCHGRYCKTPTTPTFELNTFSERGLMYVFPLPK